MMDLIESVQQSNKAQDVRETPDNLGDLDRDVLAQIDAEKQRLADLKQSDPAAYAKELNKKMSRRRIFPASVFEKAQPTTKTCL